MSAQPTTEQRDRHTRMKCDGGIRVCFVPALVIIVLLVIIALLNGYDASFVYPSTAFSLNNSTLIQEHARLQTQLQEVSGIAENISINPEPDRHAVPAIDDIADIKLETPVTVNSDDFYRQSLTEILQPEKRKVTLIINSCGRVDLLNRTISSFMKYYPHSLYPLQEKIIIDDCRQKNDAIHIINHYMPDFEIMFSGDSKLLQLHNREKDYRISTAIDKTHKQVSTEWIYHLEEDWEFIKYGFLEDAFNIFEHSLLSTNRSQYKYSIALCRTVPLEPNWINDLRVEPQQSSKNTTWYMMKEVFGFTFNAGLYPTFVYQHYGPFISDGFSSHESSIAQRMSADNLRVAFLETPKCYHIGQGRGVRTKQNKK